MLKEPEKEQKSLIYKIILPYLDFGEVVYQSYKGGEGKGQLVICL